MIRLATIPLRFAARRIRMLRNDLLRDAGASALEWAIIAAIVVLAASLVGGVVYNIVSTKTDKLKTCADQPVGSACTP